MSNPRVTVLLCVYNGEAYVREAVDSVLAQSYRDFEFLVVDDASSDSTPAVLASVRDPRLIILRNEQNMGLTRSLNAGLRAARGELVARHDADDLSHPERLARQVAFIDAHNDVVAIGSQFVSIDERGRRRPQHLWMKCETSLGIRWQLLFENPFVHSAVMFRRDAVMRAGGYDESFPTNQDFELWSRLGREQILRNLSDPLLALRGRISSISARYSTEAIRKVGDVLIANAASTLGVDWTREPAVDDLLRATNPRVFPPIETLARVVQWIDRSYRRYIELWPEARHVKEIRAHAASLIARLAILSASGSPIAMSRWYLEAARYDVPTFLRGGPRFAASSGRALFRGRQPLSATPFSEPDQETK